MRRKGFTLIELIMVITILGILAVIAVPRYFDLQDEARSAAEGGVVGAVRSGISLWHANYLVTGTGSAWPANLDSAADGDASTADPFFTEVLDEPVTQGWSKAVGVYTGPTGTTYTYTAGTGRFE